MTEQKFQTVIMQLFKVYRDLKSDLRRQYFKNIVSHLSLEEQKDLYRFVTNIQSYLVDEVFLDE